MIHCYQDLSPRQKAILDQSMALGDQHWDDDFALCCHKWGPHAVHSTRDTIYYALGLMLRGGPGDLDRAVRATHAVLQAQYDCPDEVYHGTFRSAVERPAPVSGKMDWKEISVETRYFTDLFYERVANAFRKRVKNNPALADLAHDIEHELQQAVLDEYPVVWATYDPNWREFIISTLALMLLYFEDKLPQSLISEMEHAARIGIEGAMNRSRSEFTPLNTNIRIMHVFMLDYFGVRFHDEAVRSYALEYAEMTVNEYRAHHTVPEFNSPTYNGVVLTFVGLWHMFGSSERLRALGHELETGLWEDFAEQFNPAMQNPCGPYSRAYELDITKHTALPALMYLNNIPENGELVPISAEADSYPIMVLSSVEVPEHVRPLLTASRGERFITRQFNELCERGKPGANNALCTTTSWMTDEIMIGAMAGSENSSHQLHAAVVFWRDKKGTLSTIKMLRRSAEGELKHFHTVLFDFTAGKNTLDGTARMQAGRDIVVYFEIEGPALDEAVITDTQWQLCGLNVRLTANCTQSGLTAPAAYTVEHENGVMRVCFAAPDTSKLDFHFDFELT